MDEIEKITKAKMYIEKLANGENPINNQKVADNDVVNNDMVASNTPTSRNGLSVR